jgi:hypothetical protein
VADIFDLVDLPSWLQVPEVDTETATRVRRYASGWLMSATGLTSWPTPVPDDLWAYAIELAAIAYYNPSGLSSESLDDHNVQYSAERRREILDAARSSYNTGRTAPVYSFPDPDWHWTVVPVVSPLVN